MNLVPEQWFFIAIFNNNTANLVPSLACDLASREKKVISFGLFSRVMFTAKLLPFFMKTSVN